jgi:phenylacetate-coenzyme A ligase PaaK-like adenylate-forming protein
MADFETQRQELLRRIRNVDASGFSALALEVFRFQALHNPIYKRWIRLLGCRPDEIQHPWQIPFLPIRLFKGHAVQTGNWEPELRFSSSGTTGEQTSWHAVRSANWYRENARRGFQHFFGNPDEYCWLALLPSYLERSGSSLVFMVEDFIEQSRFPQSGFFLYDTDKLLEVLHRNSTQGIPTMLIGVSFALLDLAEQHPLPLPGIELMETGGMKGRRRELTRQELHQTLQSAFELPRICSEYGMTELLSQAYSTGSGHFRPAPTMQAALREINDPLSPQTGFGKTGVLNIIDLANIDSCAFIATDDLGRLHPDGSFEVLGRLDYSDLRGCNLMVV